MKPVEVKIMLLKKGLTFVEMARQLSELNDASQRSLEVMLADLLYGRRWYPTLAEQVRERFGIVLECPRHLRPIRQQVKEAA